MPAGLLAPVVLYTTLHGFTPALDARVPPDVNVSTSWLPGAHGVGAATDTQPIADQPALTKGGGRIPGFVDDYYDRIHYEYRALDLGSVISNTSRLLNVWNAHRVPVTLAAIAGSNDDGLTLTAPETPPAVWQALRQDDLLVGVSTDGPPTIDAAYTISWSGAAPDDDAVITVAGSRITAWIWRPDWRRGITERLDWLTNVIRAYDGSEQRLRLRTSPRRGFEFAYHVGPAQRRLFEALMWTWQARAWALPVWTDGRTLAAPLEAGDTVIALATEHLDYSVGGLALLIDFASDRFEVLQVDAVGADSITALRPLVQDWPAGAWIYPAISARLAERHRLDRFTGEEAGAVAVFRCMDPAPGTPDSASPTHRGLPVFEGRHNWVATPTEEYQRDLDTFDPGTGAWVTADRTDRPTTLINHRWTATSRTEIAELRAWLYARQGKLAAFWRPSYRPDLTLAETILLGAVQITIAWDGYVKYYNLARNRRDLRIELTDGQVFYRRILGAEELDSERERLTLDADFPQEITPVQVERISYMTLRRLDSDGVELAWWTGDTAECAINLRSVPDDV